MPSPLPRRARGRLVRAVALTALVATASLLGQHAVQAQQGGAARPTQERVEDLQRQVDEVAAQLSAATEDLERQRTELDATLQADYAAATAAEQAEGTLVQARAAFAELVSASFRHPRPPGALVLISGGPDAFHDQRTLDKALGRTGQDRQQALDLLTAAQDAARTGAEQRTALTQRALAQQRDLDASLRELQDRATRAGEDLQQAADDLAAEQARQAAELARRQAAAASMAAASASAAAAQRSTVPTGGGATCLADPVGAVANGFLPESSLCFLRTAAGHRMRPSAAQAFDRMSDAYAAANGTPICITDSYRTYAGQVDVFRRKPGLAATPGRSNHGLGLALDLCGGIQAFGSPAHLWMQANAPAFGFVHPSWAQQGGSKPEAWHWEYAGPGSGTGTPVRPST